MYGTSNSRELLYRALDQGWRCASLFLDATVSIPALEVLELPQRAP